jgi:dTDP-4-dehydrorhamnose reductase
VRPTTSEAYPRPRGASYSVLGHDGWAKVGLDPIGDWQDALRHAFPEVRTAFAATNPSA